MQKKWMILILVIIVVVVIIGVALSVLAQDNQPTQPVVAIDPPSGSTTNNSAREIYTVLTFGNGVFEPENWLAGGQEMLDRTVATWASESIGGTSLAEYLHFNQGFDPATVVSEWFNNEWFTSAFSDFSTWTPQGACAAGSTTLYEFALVQSNLNYVLRYWVELMPPDRILAFQMLFPEEQSPLLEQYAQRYNANLFDCP